MLEIKHINWEKMVVGVFHGEIQLGKIVLSGAELKGIVFFHCFQLSLFV